MFVGWLVGRLFFVVFQFSKTSDGGCRLTISLPGVSWIAFKLTINCAKVLNNDSITQYYLPQVPLGLIQLSELFILLLFLRVRGKYK